MEGVLSLGGVATASRDESGQEIPDTDALDPMNIQEAGEVPYADVVDELGVAFEPEENHDWGRFGLSGYPEK